jgi:Cyclic nucleotide-binding domain
MATQRRPPFDPKSFLAKVGESRTISKYRKDQVVFSQGEAADAVFYIQKGKVEVTVVSDQGTLDQMNDDEEQERNLLMLVRVVCLSSPNPIRNALMMKIAFAVAIAAAVLTPAPLLVGTIPAEAQNLKMAQGLDVQIGRDRRRNDSDVTVGVGSGGLTVGPRQNCRTVITTVERRDGRTITRKERRCD